MAANKLLRKNSSALIISIVYYVVGFLGVYVTYAYVRKSLHTTDQIELLNNQTALRCVFVFGSSLLLFFLIRYYYQKLEKSSQQNLMLFEKNPHPMWVFDTESLQFLAVNQAAIVKYGYTQEEFLSMTIMDIRPHEDVENLIKSKNLNSGFNISGTWRHRLRNGKLIEVEISTHTIDFQNKSAKLVLAYDVTDRTNFESQMMEVNGVLEQRVNERTRELQEAMDEQAALTEELETYNEELMSTNEQLVDAQEVIRQQSRELVLKSEYKLEQVLRSVKDFVWSAQFKEGKFKIELMSPAVADVLGFTEEEYHDDPEIWVNVIAEQDRERVLSLVHHIGQSEYEEIEYCVRHPKSWQVKYLLSRIWVSKGAEYNSYQLNGIITDISERKKLEEEKSNLIKQLISQNNDLLQFSYIASHNLRGPVATLLGLISLIEREDKPSDIKAISTHLMHSTRKLDEVIIDLAKILEIRGLQFLPKEQVSMYEIIDNVKRSLESQFQSSGAELFVDFSEHDSFFTIKSYLHSIIYNLIANALKYREPARPLMIEIKSFRHDRIAGFTVTDNGMGIDMEKFKNKLFTLYQRFHTHVDGKGLGLYLVRTQTIALGGEIDVESSLGIGTSFKITLPVFSEVPVGL